MYPRFTTCSCTKSIITRTPAISNKTKVHTQSQCHAENNIKMIDISLNKAKSHYSKKYAFAHYTTSAQGSVGASVG